MTKIFIGILFGLLIATTAPVENFLNNNKVAITKTKDKISEFGNFIISKIRD